MKRRSFISSGFVITTGMFGSHPLIFGNMEKSFGIRILYNNMGEKDICTPAWGFAAFINYDGKKILFDTGGDAQVFGENLQSMGIPPSEFDYIVISHEHWDHVKGLKYLTGKVGKATKIFVPESSISNIPLLEDFSTVIPVDQALQISENIWLSGQLDVEGDVLKEESLIIDHRNELYIITGCSHPGIDKIVNHAVRMLPGKNIALVTGGFHIRGKSEEEIIRISDNLKNDGVKKVAPSHCSGDLAIAVFRKEWGSNFVELYLGDGFSI